MKGIALPLNTSVFTLKSEFCPNSLRTTSETQESFKYNNKKLFQKY